MKYEYYIKQPMSVLEIRLNHVIAKDPQLANASF